MTGLTTRTGGRFRRGVRGARELTVRPVLAPGVIRHAETDCAERSPWGGHGQVHPEHTFWFCEDTFAVIERSEFARVEISFTGHPGPDRGCARSPPIRHSTSCRHASPWTPSLCWPPSKRPPGLIPGRNHTIGDWVSRRGNRGIRRTIQPSVTIGSRSYGTWRRQSSSMKLTISTARRHPRQRVMSLCQASSGK